MRNHQGLSLQIWLAEEITAQRLLAQMLQATLLAGQRGERDGGAGVYQWLVVHMQNHLSDPNLALMSQAKTLLFQWRWSAVILAHDFDPEVSELAESGGQ